MSGLHARAFWVLDLGVTWEFRVPLSSASRRGRPLHLIFHGFGHLASHIFHTRTAGLVYVLGAYRHRASEQELRDCGGSGFIFGGLDCESRL